MTINMINFNEKNQANVGKYNMGKCSIGQYNIGKNYISKHNIGKHNVGKYNDDAEYLFLICEILFQILL